MKTLLVSRNQKQPTQHPPHRPFEAVCHEKTFDGKFFHFCAISLDAP